MSTWHYDPDFRNPRYNARLATADECQRMRRHGRAVLNGKIPREPVIAASPDRILVALLCPDLGPRRQYLLHLNDRPCDCPERRSYRGSSEKHYACEIRLGDVRIEFTDGAKK